MISPVPQVPDGFVVKTSRILTCGNVLILTNDDDDDNAWRLISLLISCILDNVDMLESELVNINESELINCIFGKNNYSL